jgi:arylsulfatase
MPDERMTTRADFAGDLRLGRRSVLTGSLATAAVAAASHAGLPAPVNAQEATPDAAGEMSNLPNMLVLWGDDIGWFNVSAYNMGIMGYRTPNIDRIGREGAVFTDWYGQNSCTAGRSAFLTGQSPMRTGLTKVGLPGADLGLQPEDPTIAELLKPLGYATGQFGKNHLGDRNEHLPTAHGFDEFFGNLYHLNAEEEPEDPDYPTDPAFKERFGPRGVIHSWATEEEDLAEDPRFGPVGKQRIEDTGALTIARMETIDDEVSDAAEAFIRQAVADGKPFFVWWNSTRMHIWTHLKPEARGVTGVGIYPDGMVEHDADVGRMLDLLDELGVTDNTIVMYSTDNGAEEMTWPDGGTTPFRGEKGTTFEGGFRVPCLWRWPGVIAPGTISNEIGSHEDCLPTLLAAAGQPEITEELLTGLEAGGRTYTVHIDGYNFKPFWAGETEEWPRHEFFYWSDDGDLTALRYDNWKVHFAEQRAEGLEVWQEEFVRLRLPKLMNVRSDPFEDADLHSELYPEWRMRHLYALVPAQAYVAQFLATFQEFPPRQAPASFSVDQVLQELTAANVALLEDGPIGTGS